MERKSYYKDLPKAIGQYKPANGYEQSLLSAMKEGLEFLSPERGIMEYGYDPFYEEEPDYLPMYLNRQIRVVYDCNDPVTDNLVDYYNSYSRETYDIIPVTTCDLSPKRRNCSAWTTTRNASSNGRKNLSTSQYKPI